MQRIIPAKTEYQPPTQVQVKTGQLLFYTVSLLFLLSAAVFGWLFYLNRQGQNRQEELKTEIRAKAAAFRSDTVIQEASLLEKRLRSAGQILSNHFFSSNALRLVERLTHPQVRFSDFRLEASAHSLAMSGVTNSFASVAQQIEFFKKDAEISAVKFGGLSPSEKGVSFNVTLTLKPDLFKKPPPIEEELNIQEGASTSRQAPSKPPPAAPLSPVVAPKQSRPASSPPAGSTPGQTPASRPSQSSPQTTSFSLPPEAPPAPPAAR